MNVYFDQEKSMQLHLNQVKIGIFQLRNKDNLFFPDKRLKSETNKSADVISAEEFPMYKRKPSSKMRSFKPTYHSAGIGFSRESGGCIMCSVNGSVGPKAWIWKMTTGCMQNSPGVATCAEVWIMNCLLMKYS